ncbi:DUF2971 domain-containing protein [Microvirga sp. 0TCS3.31]
MDNDRVNRDRHGIGAASALRPHRGAVYHYTSASGLLAIVSSGQLRVSEASSLNDLAEVQLGWTGIAEWLRERPSDGARHLRGLMKQSRQDPSHQVFVLSGTTAGDDANQWRLYAAQGTGYAIELDGAVPLGVVSLRQDSRKHGETYGRATDFAHVVPWFHVIYEEGELHKALRRTVAFADRELARIDSTEGDDETLEHLSEDLNERLMSELAMIAHLYKSNGFRGEQEVRVVARFFWAGNHVDYHASSYGIAGHIHLIRDRESPQANRRVLPPPSMTDAHKPNFVHPLPIAGVRLGPLVHKGNKETVQALLRSRGLRNARVTRSKVPLR